MNSEVSALKAFELTWVVYDPNDPYGEILALFTLSPIFIMVMYATLVVFQRDLDAIALLIGQVLNEVLNQILKRTLRQSRPQGAHMSGAGMPSAHAQFIAFFSIHVVLYTFNRLNTYRRLEQILTIVGAMTLALLVCISRVWLGYHTLEQVLVGVAVGSVCGSLWFLVTHKVSPYLFPWIVSSRLGQFLYLRDISHIPDLIVYQHGLHQSVSADTISQLKKST